MHSEQFLNVLGALAKAKAEFGPILKKQDGQVGNQKIKYADLDTVLDTVQPVLTNHGLLIMQPPEYLIEHDKQIVATYLFHLETGEWIAGTWVLTGKTDPQGMGSALTYGRRYSLLAVLGLAPEDDDGTAASRKDRPASPARDFLKEIADAKTDADLANIRQAAMAAGEWTDDSPVFLAAKARKAALDAEKPQASAADPTAPGGSA